MLQLRNVFNLLCGFYTLVAEFFDLFKSGAESHIDKQLSVNEYYKFHFGHPHLHNNVQSRLAFPQEQVVQFPLQLHLISSLVHLLTSGKVIHRGDHFPFSILQPNSDGDGTFGSSEATIQIPGERNDCNWLINRVGSNNKYTMQINDTPTCIHTSLKEGQSIHLIVDRLLKI